MRQMTSRERILRILEHREADCIPIHDSPWGSTIERWQREGMPVDVDAEEYLGLDRIKSIHVDNSPRYPHKTLEETDSYRIYTSGWGVTMKQWKHASSTPEFLDFTIVDPDSWKKAKERMTPSRDRIDWKMMETQYPKWREKGAFIQAIGWFGFDVTHSWIVGTERVLLALVEDPEWLMDMFDTELSVQIELWDLLWENGYTFDGIKWYDDMGFKKNQFFSVNMYREILKPFHQRVIEWTKAHGVKSYLHSCGDVNPFVPELVGLGLDMLNPLEVKAGMDPYYLKKTFGDVLAFHGGLNALLYDDLPALHSEIERLIPAMKENGGFMFGSDHSVPDSVSLVDFQALVAKAKALGRY